MMSLKEIGKKYPTNKNDYGFLDIYEKYFEPLREKKLNILEIGVDKGDSLRLWKEYFFNSKICGLDIEKKDFNINDVEIYQGDQNDKALLNKIVNKYGLLSRSVYKNSVSTCDSFIFFAKSSTEAINLKKHFTKFNIATKILPEAISWHFVGLFSHIEEIKNINSIKKDLKQSKDHLSKAISLPIMINDNNLELKLSKALNNYFA